jgi:aromatic-L-amino-acid/L-tryptophan decarboxylase
MHKTTHQDTGTSFTKADAADLPAVCRFLLRFWRKYRDFGIDERVTPDGANDVFLRLISEKMPTKSQPLGRLLPEAARLLNEFTVKTENPMFMGYVTPPSANVGVLGDALAAISNQNASFANLSPIGTALEMVVVKWLGEILGFSGNFGGILTSGGSIANFSAIAVARRWRLGERFQHRGYSSLGKRLRIYCSTETHHSIDKGAVA